MRYTFAVDIGKTPDGFLANVGLVGYDDLSPEETYDTVEQAIVGAAQAIGNSLLSYEDAPAALTFTGTVK